MQSPYCALEHQSLFLVFNCIFTYCVTHLYPLLFTLLVHLSSEGVFQVGLSICVSNAPYDADTFIAGLWTTLCHSNGNKCRQKAASILFVTISISLSERSGRLPVEDC